MSPSDTFSPSPSEAQGKKDDLWLFKRPGFYFLFPQVYSQNHFSFLFSCAHKDLLLGIQVFKDSDLCDI